MLGMPTVRSLRSIGTSSIRIEQDGRPDLLLPSKDRQLGISGNKAGGRWGGADTAGRGAQAAASGADEAAAGAGAGRKVVAVMWEDTRTPWGGSTEIVHRLAIQDALGVVEVRGALPQEGTQEDSGPDEGVVPEVIPYINGSMPFGEVDLRVVASQAPGSEFGSLYGTFPASGVRIGDVLLGFGCADEGLAGGSALNCDPLPPMPDGMKQSDLDSNSRSWDKVLSILSRLGLGKSSVLENARLESSFKGTAQGGQVYLVVRGVMSTWPRSSVQLFATFVPSRKRRYSKGTNQERMHWVWQLTTSPSSGLTATSLIRSISDIIAPPETDALYDMRSLALVLSRFTLSQQDLPMPWLSSMNVAAGLNMQATLVLNYNTAVGDMLLPMFAAATDQVRGREHWGDMASDTTEGATSPEWREISLSGPVSYDEVHMSGRCSDLALAGRSRLIDPMLHFIVRRFAAGDAVVGAHVGELEVGFDGTLLLPLSPVESLRLPAYMELVTPGTAAARAHQATAAGQVAEATAGEDPGGPYPYLDLVASLPTTIFSLYGEPDMHLSYVVFRFPFSGATFPHFIAEAVIALGAACSAAQLDTPGACLDG